MTCPENLYFNAKINQCDYPENVPCDLDTVKDASEAEKRSTSNTAGYLKDFCIDKKSGNYADPTSCHKFVICNGNYAISMTCPENLYFNAKINQCDYPENVPCDLDTVKDASEAEKRSTSNTAGYLKDFCIDKKSGNYADPTSCHKFVICNGNYAISMTCPENLYFN